VFWTSQKFSELFKIIQKPWEEEVLWNREKLLFENTQQLVDWEIQTRALSQQLRFGLKPVFPPKPTAFLSGTLFPCPLTECRGYINSKGQCGQCKCQVCLSCREKSEEKHKCNEAVLASLKLIESGSKPCPKCKVGIERSMGCNHMFCTFCRTHFDWTTLTILDKDKSTNFHYTQTQAFAQLQRNPNTTECQNLVEFSFSLPPYLPGTDSSLYRTLVHAFGDERKRLIFMKRSLYNEETIQRKHEETLIKLRIQYLKKDLDKEKYTQKIWSEELHYDKSKAFGTAWSLYLENMAYIIIDWRKNNFCECPSYLNQFNALQTAFQQCFDDIALDFNAKSPKFLELQNGCLVPLILL
jgi:hypothetical protein